MRNKLVIKEISPDYKGYTINFNSLHEKYGRAEFQIEPVYRGKKLVKVIICPRQQDTAVDQYIVKFGREGNLHLGGSVGGDISNVLRVWWGFWCKDHKCFGFRCYVPDFSSKLVITTGSDWVSINVR